MFGWGRKTKPEASTFQYLPVEVTLHDLNESQPVKLDLIETGPLEIVTWEPIDRLHTLKHLSAFFGISGSRFFDDVAMIGMPQKNYRKPIDLQEWVLRNQYWVCPVFDLDGQSHASTDALKQAVEKQHFAKSGHILPVDLWTMLMEWLYVNSFDDGKFAVAINGELFWRIPRNLRRKVFDSFQDDCMILIFHNAPKPTIVTERHDRICFLTPDGGSYAVNRSTPEESWAALRRQVEAGEPPYLI